ncbi:MAG: RNA polymerase subunit sigma-70 [Bacillota bacterium]|nr:MAG: RNA polymerase subunit sigma-70 [Bacillota bacterium]
MFWDAILYIIGKIVFFTGAIGEKNSFPKPLAPEEEKKYLLLAKQGDEAAKEMLIKHNLRLVVHIAKKYSGTLENDDLISVGSIGLIKAVNTFEPDKGSHLATYTARCIENEILMLLRANKKYKNDVSLSDAVGTDKDGNELSLIDLLFESEDGVFSAAERKIENERMLKVISRLLTKREYTVICLRYGLKGGRCYAQREVACFLKISRSYISRIEKKAIEKLRAHLKKEDFY